MNSLDTPQSVPPTIDEREIIDIVLVVQGRHWKAVGCIIKGKGKTSKSITLNFSSMSQAQPTEVEQCFNGRMDAQQREIEMFNSLRQWLLPIGAQPPPSKSESLQPSDQQLQRDHDEDLGID